MFTGLLSLNPLRAESDDFGAKRSQSPIGDSPWPERVSPGGTETVSGGITLGLEATRSGFPPEDN